MRRSIQGKVIAVFLLFTAMVMMLLGTFQILSISKYYQDNFVETMSNHVFTDELVGQLEATLSGGNPVGDMREILSAYSASRIGLDSYRHLYILDGVSGEPVYQDDPGQSAPAINNAVISAMAGDVGSSRGFGLKYMDYAVPIMQDGVVRYVVYIYDSKDDVYNVMQSIFRNILLALGIGLLIAVLLGFVLSKGIISPLSKLQSHAKRLASGDFDHPLEVKNFDEIGMLTVAFNNMASDLNETVGVLEQEKTKSDTILSQMTDGVLAFDLSGKLLHINPAAVNLLEMEPDEVGDFNQMAKAVGLNMRIQMFRFFDMSERMERNLVYREKHLKATFSPFTTETQGLSGVVVVFQDVTKREKLDHSRREFVANVSHELRTPLTTIKSYSETLMENMDEEKDAMSLHFLKTIDKETDRMTRIVKDLLTLSKLDNQQAVRKTNFDITALVEEVANRLSLEARKKGQMITFSKGKGIPPTFYGDHDRLEQVLVNIISNSMKYSPGGSKIEVAIRNKYTYVYIVVSDNGIGIPKEDLPRIFERFYRVDKARSRDSGGTGLGLAIAKEIVEQHDGEISMHSEVGKGTTVMIKLPIFSN